MTEDEPADERVRCSRLLSLLLFCWSGISISGGLSGRTTVSAELKDELLIAVALFAPSAESVVTFVRVDAFAIVLLSDSSVEATLVSAGWGGALGPVNHEKVACGMKIGAGV